MISCFGPSIRYSLALVGLAPACEGTKEYQVAQLAVEALLAAQWALLSLRVAISHQALAY